MKSLIASIAIVVLVGMAVGTAVQAVEQQSVTATVTPTLVSISVSPGSVAYGFVDVPSVDNLPTGDTIISVNNNGNVNEDFEIKGADATGTTITWTIVDAAPGVAAYNHKFIDCGSSATCVSPAVANNMTTTLESLAAAVVPTSTEYFKLRLSTPTETGGDTSEHSTTVTVVAIAS